MENPISYRYEPLFTSNNNLSFPFRILRLLPGTVESPLAGEIRHAHLDDNLHPPVYEALSYCWGDATEVDRIAIGSSYLPLTFSLRAALLRLRSLDVERDIWVDAICINQSDVDERSREVQFMHLIYTNAFQVLIWLEEPAIKPRYWNPQAAFKLATHLCALRQEQPDISIHKLGTWRKAYTRAKFKVGSRGYPDALRLLFTRPWFERMWVVQEAICAKAAVVICGQHRLDFKTLMSAVEYGRRSGLFYVYRQRKLLLPFHIGPSPTQISAAMAMYTLTSQPSLEDDLLSFLRRFHGSKSADPRDKLFALYGISSLDRMRLLNDDFNAMEILPDYRTDPKTLFIKTAKGILERTQNLDLLLIHRLRNPEDNRVKDLPSWVPDWSAIDADTEALCYTAPPRYSASGDSRSAPQFNDTDQSLVTLSGYVFDRVVEIGARSVDSNLPILSRPESTEYAVGALALLTIWVFEWIDWELSSHGAKGSYINGQDMVDVYWALVMALRNQQTAWYLDGLPSQDIHVGSFSNWLGRWLDRCPRIRSPRFPYIYYTIIFATLHARGLRRFSQYDDQLIRTITVVRTEKGYIGLAPATVRPGDVVILCKGGKKPLIVRPAYNERDSKRFTLIGDTYLHGIMEGEAWDESYCHPITLE
ncbi:heterokaryon incompatibility protein-domain-containing protein [Xylaria flabelliformis]|nr:heterokaryon incompatibility protein-domain-containing protein [Xylaria flabelliformis]